MSADISTDTSGATSPRPNDGVLPDPAKVYWQRRLDGATATLLPADLPHTEPDAQDWAVSRMAVPPRTLAAAHAYGAGRETTPLAVLLAPGTPSSSATPATATCSWDHRPARRTRYPTTCCPCGPQWTRRGRSTSWSCAASRSHSATGTGPRAPTFWHWDEPFLSWASERGYALDVVFDTALDDEPELLGRYGTLVTAGHDEYWTAECRERTEEFVAGGGNVLVFGGNTCWWRTEVRDSELRVAKDEANPVVGDLWWRTDRPEASLIGLSFRHGGASWLAGRPPTSYEFRPDGDALLDGVDLAAFAELTDLAGYEVDGHAYEPGRPWQPTGVEDVPDGLVVLAYAPLADAPPAHWYSDPREPHLQSPRCATIAYHRHGDALIFNGGTTDWPRHLDHPAVDRLTRNVLDAAEYTAFERTVGRRAHSPLP
ncbi:MULTISPECIES: N,N-dimethylformamidase beta subunit family domain-containing protein [Streptomyces]|uniref:N,N-dimethylformamidase beta subunit family domain-containing protein n=1 Tax=Streptomyces TaxID=1883 RepID=UPI0029AFB074|nr:N,N-dimethylformamidase beta subunit family domain-containing protein [Streptomyces sp. AK02-04a]MDX3762438.1 hypothetical protein [Streptomyces sp. AK02-04a]